MANKQVQETVKPMVVRDSETSEVYTLDFSREAVQFAERRGFVIGDVAKYPSTLVRELFFYAFRKNHKRIARDKTDALLDELGGLTDQQLARLVELYQQAALYGVVRDADEVKNSKLTVELD